MIAPAVVAVLNKSKAKGAARLLLLCIALRMGHSYEVGTYIRASTLARLSGVDRRRVTRLLRQLEALGELRTEVGKSRSGVSRYYLLLTMDGV